MTQSEFITRLKNRLFGLIPEDRINENISYYNHFFEEQLSKGKTEEEICQELGDPALIAKSILDQEQRLSESVLSKDSNHDTNQSKSSQFNSNSATHKKSLSSVLVLIVKIVIVILILILVFSLFSALLPFLLVILAFFIFFRFFNNSSR